MPKRVLVVGEGGVVASRLRRSLPGQGYELSSVGREGALQHVVSSLPDLIILDGLSAPGQTAELAQRLQRQAGSARVVAVLPPAQLAGSDGSGLYRDHVPTEEELVAWLGEEGIPGPSHVLRVGRIALDLDTRRLDVDGKVSVLTPKQYQLLSLFMSHPGETLTRKRLMKDVWETDYTGDTRTLDVHIHSVRKLLGDVPGEPRYLRTVRRVGYRFVDADAE